MARLSVKLIVCPLTIINFFCNFYKTDNCNAFFNLKRNVLHLIASD
ncbi:hypothetical protein SAMN05444673_2931 [Bacillus sp. OV166]|nr:hypothetical protein SAMN05444673_2931 [Bacillus sp. OV166]